MAMKRNIQRRQFLSALAGTAATMPLACMTGGRAVRRDRPNVVFVFADQWRAQATGYAGDPNVRTPHLDRLASESVHFTHAVSCCPVCSPYRASLITGCYSLTHGVFLNDVCLGTAQTSIAEAFAQAGYRTAYIGKWHLDGHGRSNYIPPERRHGFQFWRGQECTHDYNHSRYYADENTTPRIWDGYDAMAQTREAIRYLAEETRREAFALFLSWGPPHNPYETAPAEFRRLYDPRALVLRPNVPPGMAEEARRDLAGYYAHCSALDACIGELLGALREQGLAENTLFVFTSDHGDMLGSHGERRKQRPWDESIRVPFLLRYPSRLKPGRVQVPINTPDIMPTLLDLCGIDIPRTVEGRSLLGHLNEPPTEADGALIACYAPFGEWTRKQGGREYRGVRTNRYTYVRGIDGPWLLFDNERDPFQMKNLCGRTEHAALQARLEAVLRRKLEETRDEFCPAETYVRRWNYLTDETGTVPYKP